MLPRSIKQQAAARWHKKCVAPGIKTSAVAKHVPTSSHGQALREELYSKDRLQHMWPGAPKFLQQAAQLLMLCP